MDSAAADGGIVKSMSEEEIADSFLAVYCEVEGFGKQLFLYSPQTKTFHTPHDRETIRLLQAALRLKGNNP